MPQPGKPGYLNECPDCLHERTRPNIPADFAARFIAQYPERRKAFIDLRKLLMSWGLEETEADRKIAEMIKWARTH